MSDRHNIVKVSLLHASHRQEFWLEDPWVYGGEGGMCTDSFVTFSMSPVVPTICIVNLFVSKRLFNLAAATATIIRSGE